MNYPGISILKFNEIVPRKETVSKGRINFIIWGSKKVFKRKELSGILLFVSKGCVIKNTI